MEGWWSELAERRLEPELMDQPGLTLDELEGALRGLARVNWLSGTAKGFWKSIRPLVEESGSSPLHLLDVACGGGDIAIQLAQLAQRMGLRLKVSGCDINPESLALAERRAMGAGVEVSFFRADVINESLPKGVDIVCSSLFLHHLETDAVVQLLVNMREAATRLVLVSDLIRSRWGFVQTWCGIRLLTRSRICHVDGPLSVRAAFTLREAVDLAERAGMVGASVSKRWPERFLLTWARS
ncbi:MAG: methyltransferase domain-containing protein [Planctomycetaceae bacterium]